MTGKVTAAILTDSHYDILIGCYILIDSFWDILIDSCCDILIDSCCENLIGSYYDISISCCYDILIDSCCDVSIDNVTLLLTCQAPIVAVGIAKGRWCIWHILNASVRISITLFNKAQNVAMGYAEENKIT